MSPKLPPLCFALHQTDLVPILVLRGEMGYYGIEMGEPPDDLAEWVRLRNESLGVSRYQMEAMVTGSMFGCWDAAGADPDFIEERERAILARTGSSS